MGKHYVRLRWRFGAEQHHRTIQGKLWRFDKQTPVEVPPAVLAEIREKYWDVLEEVRQVPGNAKKWKPVEEQSDASNASETPRTRKRK